MRSRCRAGQQSASRLATATKLPKSCQPHASTLLAHPPTSSTTETSAPAVLPDRLSHFATSTRPAEHPRVPIHHPTVDHDSISVLDQNDQPTSPSASHPVTPLTATLHPKGLLKYLFLCRAPASHPPNGRARGSVSWGASP